ncbi:unnamed protein product [Schistocephalus solidus]|uniref:NSFL1 cofactor p47 n=1 Tax=Schistocephalus solidus TaxID=70667 RepID=A0A183SLS6_SCHSO|nr:unnamed protein product [Schistocephalus solidus]
MQSASNSIPQTEPGPPAPRVPPKGSSTKIATLSSISQHPQSPDSEEDNQAFYVGGAETGGGGQQVLGPPRPKKGPSGSAGPHVRNPEDFVRDVFQQAREGGAETLGSARVSDMEPSRNSAFTGAGYRLGETLNEPTVVIQGEQTQTEAGQEKTVIVKMWQNGFSLDDGPLRPYSDPESQEFMECIKRGQIPRELVSSSNTEVHVLLEDHHTESYTPPPTPKVKAFSGTGHMLGNPTPRVVFNKPVPTNEPHPVVPHVDETLPSTQIQVRLPDGSRLLVKLNNDHRVSDLRSAILRGMVLGRPLTHPFVYKSSERPEFQSQPFGLITAFPRKELSNEGETLADAKLLNASVILTLK